MSRDGEYCYIIIFLRVIDDPVVLFSFSFHMNIAISCPDHCHRAKHQ